MMGGYFTYNDIIQIHAFLSKEFPAFVSPIDSIGKTYEGAPMPHFKVGLKINIPTRQKKSSILFSALHHSREPTSLSTLMAVVFDALKDLHQKKNSLYEFTDLDFIPIVNVDSYKLINAAWGTVNWGKTYMVRKNRNVKTVPCPNDPLG
jgi:carboxypeptidase T